MEVGCGNGNPSPSLAGPPPPGSGSNSSTSGDMAKNTVIAIFSTITGAITTYLIAKLWKLYFKPECNTPADAAPPPNPPPSVSTTQEHYNTPPTSPSDLRV
ncbi:hypothetical protein FH972_005712 [Carpinus fangiana]|uniref:Uncharacterized protein n=1 Tax=Carpinus fangiana TaxID=176857 RepID=A0A5N6QQF9_9ROSI|nr:hypothetical protein FH972_005712 [Carpinus fangiana]